MPSVCMRVNLLFCPQVCLYDVRRLSSSTIVNFGSSRASQQLLLSHNLKARAQAAGLGTGGCSVMYGVAHEPQFLCDAVLNPADPNLLAYIKPNLQVCAHNAQARKAFFCAACKCLLARFVPENSPRPVAQALLPIQCFTVQC